MSGSTTRPILNKTTSHTIALSDLAGNRDLLIRMTSDAPLTVKLPTHRTAAIPIDTVIEIYARGLGQVMVTGSTGVVIRTATTRTSRSQYSSLFLRKDADNEWVLSGDTT